MMLIMYIISLYVVRGLQANSRQARCVVDSRVQLLLYHAGDNLFRYIFYYPHYTTQIICQKVIHATL